MFLRYIFYKPRNQDIWIDVDSSRLTDEKKNEIVQYVLSRPRKKKGELVRNLVKLKMKNIISETELMDIISDLVS